MTEEGTTDPKNPSPLFDGTWSGQTIQTFQDAIRATHSCRSDLRERQAVHERDGGRTVWEGDVLIFDLIGHPTALTCYAWSVDQQVTAVLREEPIDSPQQAVRAALIQQRRGE